LTSRKNQTRRKNRSIAISSRQRHFVRSLLLERAWFRIVYTLGSSFFFHRWFNERERKGEKTSRNRSRCFCFDDKRERERERERKRVGKGERGLVSYVRQEPAWCKRPPCMLAASPSTEYVSTGGGELRFRCVMCGRGYRSRSSLTRHSRYECGRLGSRYTFTCTLCGKYFCRPDHLKQHILNIHGNSVAK